MALEKKFSDFQKSECLDRDVDTPIDDRFCPTCVPNSSFKMEGYFYDIEEPFLHEGLCEYWVRVYDVEARNRYKVPKDRTVTDEQIIKTGVEKILIHFDKVLNKQSIEYLQRSAFFSKRDSVASSVHSTNVNKDLGYANLVKVPHFNFSSIPSTKDSDESDNENDDGEVVEEVILQHEGLYRKLVQINGALLIYGYSYSLMQNSIDNSGFVIRQKDNPSALVNYESVRAEVMSFRDHLNSALIENGYGGLGSLNSFREQCKKIKLVFNPNISEYYLESIYVLSEQCPDEYKELDLRKSPKLKGVKLRKAYHFMANLDEVINDITSRETKPWLDFTIDRFYPEMIVDYGKFESISEEDYAELGCLLDKAGFGGGQFVDYLGKSLVSSFKSAEEKLYETACRSKEDIVRKSATTISDTSNVQKEEDKNWDDYDAYIQFIINQLEKKYKEGFITKPLPVEPPPPPPPPPPSYSEGSYTVVKGDTMYEIASKLNVNINSLLELNPQFDKALLPAWKKGSSPSRNDRVGNNNRNPNWIYPGESLIYRTYDQSQESMEMAEEQLEVVEEIVVPEPDRDIYTNEQSEDPLSLFIDYSNFIFSIKSKIDDATSNVIFDDEVLSDSQSFILASFSFESLENFQVPDGEKLIYIGSSDDLYRIASNYQAFKDSQRAVPIAYEEKKDQKKRNPHINAIVESWKEEVSNENTLLGLLKTDYIGQTDISTNGWINFVTSIGLCGMTKLSKKLFKCLLGGTTLDQFYNAAFIKIFEFMEINTLSLFLNGLPLPIRQSLNEAIESEFGSSLSLEDLIGISKERGGNIGDYVSFSVNKELANMFINENDPLSNPEISPRRKRILTNYLGGKSEIYEELVDEVTKLDKAQKRNKKIQKITKKAKRKYLKGLNSFDDSRTIIRRKLDLFGSVGNETEGGKKKREEYLKELSSIERTAKSLEDNNLGESVDVVFDIFYDFLIDLIIDEINADELVQYLSSFPAGEILVGIAAKYYMSCPKPTVFSPPAKDFMKSLSVDICDPEFNLKLPNISLPSLSLRYNISKAFGAAFSELILKLFSDIVVGLIKRTLNLLEDLICKSLGALGNLAADALVGNVKNEEDLLDSFQSALDKAFCGGSRNPQTGESRAKELADALFRRALPESDQFNGAGAKAANIISSVASQEEILQALVDGNDKVNKLVSSACNVLMPEMEALLGSPDQVAFFFQNLGSFLPEEDKQRIRDLLEAGVPNLPLSSAICLTNDQLNQWNDLRNQFLQNQGFTPEQAFEEIDKLNEMVEDALGDVIGDQIDLSNPEGPFIGALSDEALKDVCNPENLFNDNSSSDLDKQEMSDLSEEYYNNIHRLLMWGYYGKNGIFGNALRDVEDKREGLQRSVTKLFNPNYNNSYSEQISKFDNGGLITKFSMRALSDDADGDGYPDVNGNYPETVGLYLLQQIKDNTKANLPDGVNCIYSEDGYSSRLLFQNFNQDSDFGYDCSINERDELTFEKLVSFKVKNVFSKQEKEFLSNLGAPTSSGESVFKSFVKSGLNQPIDYATLYRQLSNDFFEKTMVEVTTDDRVSGGTPIGFRFGYVSDTITSREDWDYLNPDRSGLYDLDESLETLGVFRNERIIPLNPKLYGGSYSRPAWTLEKRKFFGWLEYATKAFEPEEGCDPKSEPMISMADIKDRVKFLDNNLKNYAQLETDPECTHEKPFKLLVDKKIRSNIDGVVRTTLRTYLSEYFLMGIGAFSNIEMSNRNYDSSFSNFVIEKMKSEMYDLGDLTSLRRISLKQEKYWYTFLEQCVQSYNEMVKLKELVPPPEVSEALNNLRLAQAAYRGVGKNVKFLMKRLIENGDEPIKKKDMTIQEKLSLLNKPGRLSLMSMEFRIKQGRNERDNFFDNTRVQGITVFDTKIVSIKKLKFFNKILTIKMFEYDCITIMKELIHHEFERFSKTAFSGIRDKPKISDMSKAFFGFKSFFPKTTSRIGLGQYYIEKQLSGTETGTVPDVSSTNQTTPMTDVSKPHFIVEKYARLEPKISNDTPSFILNAPDKLTGVCKLSDLENFITTHSGVLSGKRISDFYGDLKFSYRSDIESLFQSGFVNRTNIDVLINLNQDIKDQIEKAHISFSTGRRFESFPVIHDESLLSNKSQAPVGTLGSTGISYGLRICLVLPPGYVDPSSISRDFISRSKIEKSYLYEDGGYCIPLCSEEISVVDTVFDNFNPTNGTEPYDLECLINKIVQKPEFTIFFTTLMPLLVAPSFAAIFYSQNFMGSLGQGEGERSEEFIKKLKQGKVEASSDDWDGTMNTFVKNFLRREFQSFYLSNSADGFGVEDLSSKERTRLFGSYNPFDSFALPSIRVPWFKKKRLKLKVYDSNGEECANPKKDFES